MGSSRYLTLANGRVFKGKPFGASGGATAEIVFTTGMTGYLETLTDPSYYGQMVVQAFPLIGNYGVIPADFESEKPALSAYIVRSRCQNPSNFRSEEDLDTFLLSQGIVGIWDVDTRELIRILREYGVMNAAVGDEPLTSKAELEELNAYRVEGAVQAVGKGRFTPVSEGDPAFRVVLWNFGAKRNIARELVKRGCEVVFAPASATAEEILAQEPDGILLSNGPGDPAENTGVIHELKKLCGAGVPIFGICLGHQLLALANGGETMKLKYGHRGANQPVQETRSGRVFITSQNHGYAVCLDQSLPEHAKPSFLNLNDGTCEGMEYENIDAFSVQFHPEAYAGPLDTRFLFDRFVGRMDQRKNKSR